MILIFLFSKIYLQKEPQRTNFSERVGVLRYILVIKIANKNSFEPEEYMILIFSFLSILKKAASKE